MRPKGWILLAVAVALFVAIAWGPPIVQGWHLGYNSATDGRCETRVGLQWCSGLASPPSSGGTSTSPSTSTSEARRQREAAEARTHEAEARAREQREEAERPAREARERKQTEREALESEGKAP